jgi:putative hydrolase of the HAD superfamily
VYAVVAERYHSQYTLAQIAERFVQALHRQEAIDHANGLRTSEEREIERWRNIVMETLDDVSDPEACFHQLFDHFGLAAAWRCDSDAEAVMRVLANRGYLLGLASNYDHRLRSVAAGLPALRPIRHLVISSVVGWRKPAPQFFAALGQTLGLAPENILYVGDDLANDYQGALAAGMHAVLLDSRSRITAEVRRIAALKELAILL